MSPSTRRSKSLLAAGASAASPLSKTPTRQKIKLEPIDSPILTDQKRQSSYFVKEEGSIVKKEELPDPFTPSKGPQLKSAKDENVTPSKRRKVRTIRGPPKNWRTMYDGIRDWRKDNMAPVDSMGCDILAQSDTPQLFRYQTLVALQLSSQTKDPVTAEAVRNLQGHPKGGLSIDSVLDMSDAELNGYICKVGFHNRKTM